MSATARPVMDWPEAWAFVRDEHPDPSEHADRCSWVVTGGGMLCDCPVLWNEYARRAAVRVGVSPPAKKEPT
jgi:hypothetical protein